MAGTLAQNARKTSGSFPAVPDPCLAPKGIKTCLGRQSFFYCEANKVFREKIMWPPKFSDAIDACNVARRRCERLVTAGLAQPDVNVVASVLVTARDTARIATLTSQMLEG